MPAGALDLPGRELMMVDVPGFPIHKYRVHKENYEFLSQGRFATLDWSFACPGVMLHGPQQVAGETAAAAPLPARISVDQLPVHIPAWPALLPNALLLPAVATFRGQLVGPTYGEVAAAMVAHLAPGGPMRHRRVGFWATHCT
jgi:hypothetical protein